MRKSTIFISAVLTTFALVMLYSVGFGISQQPECCRSGRHYRGVTATLAPEPTNEAVPTKFALSAVQAAQVATQVLGNSSLLSAESSNLNGVDALQNCLYQQ
jgi:hypothetical protein